MSKKVTKKVSKKVSKRASKNKTEVASQRVPLYKALRAEGIKKRKAARIAKKVSATLSPGATPVAQAPETSAPPELEVPVTPLTEARILESAAATALDDLTKADLLAQAREQGVPGRSTMSKGELLAALRAREHVNA